MDSCNYSIVILSPKRYKSNKLCVVIKSSSSGFGNGSQLSPFTEDTTNDFLIFCT